MVRTFSNEGDTVLDPCMGSGTTGSASLNTNRDFIGIERDTDYYTIAEKRLQTVDEVTQDNPNPLTELLY